MGGLLVRELGLFASLGDLFARSAGLFANLAGLFARSAVLFAGLGALFAFTYIFANFTILFANPPHLFADSPGLFASSLIYLQIIELYLQSSCSTHKKAPHQWHFFIIPRKTAGRRIPSIFPPIRVYNIGRDLFSHFPPDPLHNGRQGPG